LSAELLVTVAASCRRPERLRFRYVDGQGRATERHVEPYQLVYSGRRWYLVARDRDREAWRTFRVDRMRDPIPTGIRVVHVDPPDSAALVAEGTAVAAYTHQAKVLLEAPLEVAAEYVSPTVAVLEPGRDGTILRVGADELDWIARYLARLPFRFEVIEPEGLRAALSAVADRLMAAARS
jgi:predicted DNA-binding transcriptional regulator YafY